MRISCVPNRHSTSAFYHREPRLVPRPSNCHQLAASGSKFTWSYHLDPVAGTSTVLSSIVLQGAHGVALVAILFLTPHEEHTFAFFPIPETFLRPPIPPALAAPPSSLALAVIHMNEERPAVVATLASQYLLDGDAGTTRVRADTEARGAVLVSLCNHSLEVKLWNGGVMDIEFGKHGMVHTLQDAKSVLRKMHAACVLKIGIKKDSLLVADDWGEFPVDQMGLRNMRNGIKAD